MFPPSGAPARFDIGRVIERMFGVLAADFPVFALLALVLAGIPAAATGVARLQVGALGGGFSLIGVLVSVIASALLQGAVIHATISNLNGRRASVGECLRTAFAHLLPLIGIGLAVGVATFLGFIFFIVPGVLIALAFSVSVPVRVVERLGVFDSMGRSANLTRNHRGMIFLLSLLYFVAYVMVTAVDSALGAAASVVLVVVNPLVETITALVGAAGIASLYFELRTIKEGIGVEALAAIFD